MNWKVGLTDEARNDFKRLDGREKKLIAKQLVKLEKNPFCGKRLGKKMDMDLTGFYKLYADKKKLRIVYSVEGESVHIIAIGEREQMDVYKKVNKRYLS
ncbi:MAG TPA: addiction module toxin RelE [Desulfobacterales bacterium]|nr:addiction module toxin RelE [Desulfobacterales bacterium]